jgi:hypothetical protein
MRLLREARIAATLEHDSIARIYDVDVHEGTNFVAMEYVRGVSLRSWMSGQHSPIEIVVLAAQIAEGLAFLHAKGVVHRDLKPENVMLPARGGIKLLDFGIAREIAHTTADGAHSGDRAVSSTMAGTPGYIAPEQSVGGRIDARVDVFSLGVVLCELVTGRRPAGAAPGTQERSAFADPAWAPYPQAFREVISRMVLPDAAARWSDGAEVLAALHEIRAGHAEGSWGDPDLSSLASKVAHFWLDTVLTRAESEGLVPQGRHVDFNLVSGSWEATFRAAHDDDVLSPHTSAPEFFEEIGRFLLIVGDAGCGKTVHLLLLARHLLHGLRDPNAPVPVVLNLSTWRKGLSISEWLVLELGATYQVPRAAAERWVKSNRLAPLLDALDEVPSEVRADCVAAINEYVAAQTRPPALVLTSRVEACQALAVRPALNAALHLEAFSREQVEQFLSALDLPTRERVVRLLGAEGQVVDAASTPLLLHLMARVCEQSEADGRPLTTDRDVQTQICELYVNKVVRPHFATTAARVADLDKHLQWLARRMANANLAVFRIEDIQPTWLEHRGARLAYALSSRLLASGAFALSTILCIGHSPLRNSGFQVTPKFAADLALAGGLVTGLGYAAIALLSWMRPQPGDRSKATGARRLLPLGVALLFAAGTTVALARYAHPAVTWLATEYALLTSVFLGFARPSDGRDIRMHERQTWRAGRVLTRIRPVLAAVALTAVVLAIQDDLRSAVMSVGVVLVGGVVVAGIEAKPMGSEDRTNSGIRSALWNAVAAFVGVFVLATLAFGPSYGGWYGATVALTLATLASLRLGGVDALYHYVLRCALAIDGIGLQLAERFDEASDAGLLRKIGGGYIFRHRLLTDYYEIRGRS